MPCVSCLLTVFQPIDQGSEAVGGLWGDGLGAASPFGWAPFVLLGGPLVVAVVLLWLYARAAREHRRALMAPPVWLLPYLERSPVGEGEWRPPAPDADHAELEEIRLESTARLARRKRVLLMALGLNFVAGWAGAAVYLYAGNRSIEFEELPLGASLGSSVDTASFQGIEGPGGPVVAPPEPAVPPPAPAATELGSRREQEVLVSRRRDSVAELRRAEAQAAVRRRDSVALVETVAQRVRDSVIEAMRDSAARAQTAAVPAPAPPPPPPPPAPPPAPPVRDPAVELARAGAVIRAGVEALAAAITGRTGLQGVLAAGGQRDQFVRFVEQQSPTVAGSRVPEPIMSTDRAESQVTLQFQWRGPFGDTRRGTGRFAVEARPVDGNWQVVRLVALNTPQ